jgi:hypothetical protein
MKDIELIEWIDSYSFYEQWDFIQDLDEPKILKCKSIGFVVKEDDDSVMMLPHISGDYEGGKGGICIPKISIIKRTRIKPVKI